jgi:hypothetical protein
MPNTKRAGGVAHSVGPEFKPQYNKKNFFFFDIIINISKYLCYPFHIILYFGYRA